MAVYFFDSSAIVKRYISETGSVWVTSVVDPMAGNHIHLADITGVEVVSAIARRQRGSSLSSTDAATAIADFRHDFTNQYRVAEMTPAIIDRAMSLAETHALRAYDAVQLAAALEVNASCVALGVALTLVSADAALNAAATTEGLTVDDPNSHP